MERPGYKARALIALLAFTWAAQPVWAAHLAGPFLPERGSSAIYLAPRRTVPQPVRLRLERGKGLLIQAWLNGHGPYIFAVDTGAGMTLIRTRIAAEAGLTSTSRERVQIAGISNSESVPAQRTFINELAVGDSANVLPSGHRALTVSSLPTGIDGVLDPTTAYAPLGYVIDLPRRQLLAFDTNTNRLRSGTEPAGGAVVRWVRERGGTRPFVRLGDNRLALIDTGSGFGLAIAQGRTASGANYSERAIRDLSGGAIKSNRVAPSTVTIGSLVLRGVPTDVLIGAHDAAPVLLGRDALYPFRITFDPASLLIEIVPSE